MASTVPPPANDDNKVQEVAGTPATSPTKEQPPSQVGTYDCTEQDPDFWLHSYEERACIRQFDGEMSREQAEHLAYEETLLAWHKAHYRPRLGYCGGCQQISSPADTILLADGATIHNNNLSCSIVYGNQWRVFASFGLSLLGINKPITWSKFEGRRS